MSELLRWLFDLDSLRFGQEGVELGLTHSLAPWAWALILLAAAALAAATYRRITGARGWRVVLAAVRAGVLALIVLLLAGPRLIKPNEREEKDWVVVLLDRSASMRIKDAPAVGGVRASREDQLREALSGSRDVWDGLSRDRVVEWIGFDGGVFDLVPTGGDATANESDPTDPGSATPVELADPDGRRTAIGRALDQVMRRAAARPVSGIVVMSDGRSIDGPGAGVLRRLKAEHIPVFAVPLGSAEPVADLSLREVRAPRVAYVDDIVPVRVDVERLGAPGATMSGRVELVDAATGEVLDSKPLQAMGARDAIDSPVDGANDGQGRGAAADRASGGVGDSITLSSRRTEPGDLKWLVRVVPDAPDLVAENNTREVSVSLVDQPLRVMYVDGYPRWEYRYLKNLFLREPSVNSTVNILAAGRRYLQEGDRLLERIPTSPEEWREYDVVVLGDLRSGVFTPAQLEGLRQHIGVSGAGLVWIAGEGAMPGDWRSTPVADLLPFTLSDAPLAGTTASHGTLPVWNEPVVMRSTPLAERLGVLRLASDSEGEAWWPAQLSDARTGWSRLWWMQRIEPALLKPAAEVLAVVESAADNTARAPGTPPTSTLPAVVSMRYGAGRVIYVATDEVWRWRYGRGELLTERFWLPLVRLAGRESLSRSGRGATLTVVPARAEVDQPVRIAVELLDQMLLDAAPASIRVRVARVADAGDATDLPTTDQEVAADLTLLPEAAGSIGAGRPRTFAATWLSSESGRFRVMATDALLVAEGLSEDVEVWLPEDELRTPQTDHPTLAALAEETGGAVLAPDGLSALRELLPNRRVVVAGQPDVETLWDTPAALIAVMLLLTLEWAGRRLIRLT